MQDDGYNYVADLARVVAGEFEEYIVTHPGRSQYSQTGGGVSACGIAAMNCARLVLGFHATGLGTSQLVEELMRRQFLEVRLPVQPILPSVNNLTGDTPTLSHMDQLYTSGC